VAMIDWASRASLSWRLSNTRNADFCVCAPEDALMRYGRPDQGSQVSSAASTGQLEKAGIRFSMGGPGRWMDDLFAEQLWRSMKYEDAYSKGSADGHEACAGVGVWITSLQHPMSTHGVGAADATCGPAGRRRRAAVGDGRGDDASGCGLRGGRRGHVLQISTAGIPAGRTSSILRSSDPSSSASTLRPPAGAPHHGV
jgi:transposase InsO family protein